MRFFLVLLILFTAFSFAPGEAAYSLRDALEEMGDPRMLLAPASPPRTLARFSSADPAGGSFDRGRFLRREEDEWVLFDHQGPGVLLRLWSSEPNGILRFYWDGAAEPQFVVPWNELVEGDQDPFVPPFAVSLGGAWESRFPLPFSQSLKITLTGPTAMEWQADYAYFQPGTPVETWFPALGVPSGVPEAFSRAENVLSEPSGADMPRESEETLEINAYEGAQPVVWSPSSDIVVTEIELETINAAPIPGAFMMRLESPVEDRRVEIPWSVLIGGGENGDVTGLWRGRRESRSWFRVPFVVRTGEKLIFDWKGEEEGEVLGKAHLKTISPQEPETAPSLMVAHGGDPSGVRMSAPAGRVLYQVSHFDSPYSDAYLQAGEIIAAGEMAIQGTSLKGLFPPLSRIHRKRLFEDDDEDEDEEEEAVHEPPAPFPFASVSRFDENRRVLTASHSFAGLGVPFGESFGFRYEEAAPAILAAVKRETWLIGQRFDHITSATALSEALSMQTVDDPLLSRTRTHARRIVKQNGKVQLEEFGPPIVLESPDFQRIVGPETEVIRGEFSVTQKIEGATRLGVYLDLPVGWTGRMTGPDGWDAEVYSIGWPFYQQWFPSPTSGTLKFTWEARPEERVDSGLYSVQLRAELEFGEVESHPATRLVAVNMTAPRHEPVFWWEDETGLVTAGNPELPVPEAFQPQLGDWAAIRLETGVSRDRLGGIADLKLKKRPAGLENAEVLAKPFAPFLPENGVTPGDLILQEEPSWTLFPVGRFGSWLDTAPELLSLESPVEDWRATAFGIWRRPAPPMPIEGWSRRIPIEDIEGYRLIFPRSRKALRGEELLASMKLIVGTPGENPIPESRIVNWLENVEAAPMGWRVKSPGPRPIGGGVTATIRFPAEGTGSRIAIYDEAIQGRKFFAFRFGFGPDCGAVGIRDCEGRLVLVQDLFMSEPAVFPQLTVIELLKPSRDPCLYIESLGAAPGSLAQHISIERLLIFDESPIEED